MNSVKSSSFQRAFVAPLKIPVEVAGLDAETQGSAQESTPIPFAAGENIVAARWLSPILNQFAQIAPEEARGKK